MYQKIRSYQKGTFLKAEKMLNKSRNGTIKVTYKQRNGVGRRFASKGLSLQSLCRQMRHTIARDYVDIDMVNAHPTLLLFVCEQLKIQCPMLRKYCQNREKFFGQNNLTKEEGKDLMIQMLYGGSKAYKQIEDPSPDLEMFKDEMKETHARIAGSHLNQYELYKEEITKGEKNQSSRVVKFYVILRIRY